MSLCTKWLFILHINIYIKLYCIYIFFVQNELFLLVTDQGFLTEDRVIWESLANVEGDSYFVDAEFRLLPTAQSTAPAQPSNSAHLSPMNQQLSLEDQE